MQIPVGTILTWQGSYTRTFMEKWSGTSKQDVSDKLSQFGFVVRSIDIQTGFLDQFLGSTVTATIILQNNAQIFSDDSTGQGAGEDQIRSNIEMAIMQATGNFPTSSTITKVQLPTNAPTPVGQPAPGVDTSRTCPGGLSGSLQKFLGQCNQAPTQVDSPSKSFSLSSLTSGATLYIGLAIFGFIAALALIGYSGALKTRV